MPQTFSAARASLTPAISTLVAILFAVGEERFWSTRGREAACWKPHPDHIGGLLDANGAPRYRHARLYLHPLEAEYWQDDAMLNRANARGQRNFTLARRALDAYSRSLGFLDKREAVAGIRPLWLPGHTPGHSGFRIDAAAQSLLIWGDIVHFPHIQTARPAAAVAFDCDPAQARATREAILAQAVSENLLIAGMHLGGSGFAHIVPTSHGYRIQYSAP